MCILAVWLLLNHELLTFANLILDLFADVLYWSKSDVCGLTDIHKSTYNSDQLHCGDFAPHPPTQLSTSSCCYNSICYRMDYTLQVDKQGQLLAHWLGQSQGHQQALNQVHHQAIKSAPPLSDWHVTTNLAQSILSVGQLHQLCFSSSHTSCSSSHSAPTLLLLHSHAATQLQLHHFLHSTLTDLGASRWGIHRISTG